MFFIKKIKNGNKRTIILFNVLKFTYTKKSQDKYIPKNVIVGDNTILLENVLFNYSDELCNPIKIGNNTIVDNIFTFNEAEHGEIVIGDRCFINTGTNLVSRSKIDIGDDVTIGYGVSILDHNFHSVDWKDRRNDILQKISDYKNGLSSTANRNWKPVKTKPIKICNKAWICANVTILNGVTIGEGAIVSAGSVVKNDVAPWTIVAGNPAQFVKELQHDNVDTVNENISQG